MKTLTLLSEVVFHFGDAQSARLLARACPPKDLTRYGIEPNPGPPGILTDRRFFDEDLRDVSGQLASKYPVEKLAAMKRLMAMITIGRDVSSFFPDVVKNIVVESQEVKKLVYMYLIHYAEQNQELALLSINSFQKDLASHSQRVRANAMKAMSSIRIPVAVPLVILALKSAVKDPSSYVRRAAAAAIPKVWSVDPEQHDLLVELVIELLTNNEPLVLGSAIFAFNAVCPDRYDLLHPHFRKICHLLADFDEWGQIITLDLLLRYGRTQFLDPVTASSGRGQEGGVVDRTDALSPIGEVGDLSLFHTASATPANATSSEEATGSSKKSAKKSKSAKKKDQFYSDDESDASDSSSSSSSKSSGSDSDSDSDSDRRKKSSKKLPNPPALPAAAPADPFPAGAFASRPTGDESELDEDHRLLLKQASQLLQSSNTGVIVAVSSLMWSLAPCAELAKVVKPLVRLARNKRNIQYIVLINIATMASSLPLLFRPYLKDFLIFPHEPRYIKDLKLDILTCITSEANIGVLMKEFTCYTQDPDKEFVVKCIQAIGRCAQAMPGIAERCIRGLMALVVKNAHAGVVAQSIVVIRQLLQSQSSNIRAPLLAALAKLLDVVTIPQARTAIVWMVGEYRDRIPKLAPDVLRKLAKSFPTEDEEVKVQILNLALKLFLANSKQTASLFKYVMDLCKYDLNIDLRDRARMMRSLFFKKKAAADAPVKDHGSDVKDHFKSILLTEKPAPNVAMPFAGRDKWILGSLSHALNQQVQGYKELPEFPIIAPDTATRKPKIITADQDAKLQATKAQRKTNKQKRSRRNSRSSGSESDSRSDWSSSDSESGRSRSGSDSDSDSRSDESEFSSFASESESDASSRSGRSRSGSSSAASDSGSDSGSNSGSDSDASRRKRSKKPSRRARKSRSRSRSPSASPVTSPSAAPAGASWSLDFLDLQGLDLSSGALADPNLGSGGFGALGDSQITFTHPSAAEDMLSPFAATPSAPSTVSTRTAASAAAAEDAILSRAFGGK